VLKCIVALEPRVNTFAYVAADEAMIEAWLAGRAPTYENTTQRKNEESADFRGKTEKARKGQKEEVEDKEAEAEKRAREQMDQWAELQAYLPYVFLGDPSRYDRPRSP
jgi:hypothetical protein